MRKSYEANREERIRQVTEYKKKFVTNSFKFIRNMDCPKCGKRGQLNHLTVENMKTGWTRTTAIVTHHKDAPPCYLGPVREAVAPTVKT